MGKLNKSNLAAVMALLVAFSVPRAVAVAPPQDWDLEGTFYSPGDCSGTGFDSCTSPTYSLTAEQLGRRPNILVIVADDQAYCQYGFMAGYCDSNPHLSCQYDRDCPLVGEDFDMCKRDAAGTTHDPGAGGATLRLNDPACRYRQRPAAKRTTRAARTRPWFA
jgi:hypothetical protein